MEDESENFTHIEKKEDTKTQSTIQPVSMAEQLLEAEKKRKAKAAAGGMTAAQRHRQTVAQPEEDQGRSGSFAIPQPLKRAGANTKRPSTINLEEEKVDELTMAMNKIKQKKDQ
jgi:hypothetical protein